MEMMAIMGGYPPPADEKAKAAYFDIFMKRVADMYGENAVSNMLLLAGCAPEAL
jgi:hypothetical protein